MREFILNCYRSWIEQNIPRDEIVGNCTLWARVMKQAFPELILLGGYVNKKKIKQPTSIHGITLGEDGMGWSAFDNSYHEYLRTTDGDIVDPTAIQFDAILGKGKWEYDQAEEHLLYQKPATA